MQGWRCWGPGGDLESPRGERESDMAPNPTLCEFQQAPDDMNVTILGKRLRILSQQYGTGRPHGNRTLFIISQWPMACGGSESLKHNIHFIG